MIASVRGTLTAVDGERAVIEVGGLGLEVLASGRTLSSLVPHVGEEASLYTYLNVREDALQLFGFITEEERAMFRLLLGVTGIGPKMALGILSGLPVIELRRHLASGNLSALTAIPGIGRKLAERLVLELREKITRVEVGGEIPAGPPDDRTRIRQEAIMALMSLGFARPAADRALHAALQTPEGTNAPLETHIKLALRHAAKTS